MLAVRAEPRRSHAFSMTASRPEAERRWRRSISAPSCRSTRYDLAAVRAIGRIGQIGGMADELNVVQPGLVGPAGRRGPKTRLAASRTKTPKNEIRYNASGVLNGPPLPSTVFL